MGKLRWTGNAQTVTQLNTITPANVGIGNTFTVTMNGKTITFTATATTVANVTAGLVALLNASTIPEFAGVTWADITTAITATSDTPGRPFTQTSSASGGTATLTTVATTAASGPNFWNVAANWSTGAIPATGDDAYVDNSDVSILYGLANSAVLLNSLTIAQSFTGDIGLPKQNADGYIEYLADYLAIGFQGAFQLRIGTDTGNGSGRIKIDAGSTKVFAEIIQTGNGAESGLAPVLFKGTHANNTLEIKNGQVDVAPYGGELATVDVLRNSGGSVELSTDVTVNTIINGEGQTTVVTAPSSTIATITQTGGTLTVQGACAVTAATVTGGTLKHEATGTVAALTLGPGTYDRSGDVSPVTISSLTLNPGAVFNDPYKVVTCTAIVKGTTATSLTAA